MPNAAFLMTVGGLGVSFAGFAGLITALDRRPTKPEAVIEWRIRNLVLDSFMITAICFGAVALFEITDGDLALTIRIAAVVALLRWARAMSPSNLTGPAWEGYGKQQWWFSILGLSFGAATWVFCFVVATMDAFLIVVLFSMFGPMTILYNTIHDAAAPHESSHEA